MRPSGTRPRPVRRSAGSRPSSIERLRARFAPQRLAALRAGQVVSRASSCRAGRSALYWRRDGKAVVARRRADRRGERRTTALRPTTARELLEGVARAPRARSRRGRRRRYEDPWHFIGQERKLPENLDPATNRLDDPMARARLARVFERGLGKPVGYVLPVQRWNAAASRDAPLEPASRGRTRSGKLFLVPGDSPLGFRLPLPSLAYICRRRSIRTSCPPIRSSSAASCRTRIRSASRSCAASRRERAAPATDGRSSRRRAALRARRSPWSRATGGSACSCRRWPSSRTTSICSRPSRTRAPSSTCRFTSKATSRRATRG